MAPGSTADSSSGSISSRCRVFRSPPFRDAHTAGRSVLISCADRDGFFFSFPLALSSCGVFFFFSFLGFWGFSGLSGLGSICIRAGPAITVTLVSARSPTKSARTPIRSSDSRKKNSRMPSMMYTAVIVLPPPALSLPYAYSASAPFSPSAGTVSSSSRSCPSASIPGSWGSSSSEFR